MAYRSNPDHTFIEFAPSIGITGYVYGHHGTVASADVTLVALKIPKLKGRPSSAHREDRLPGGGSAERSDDGSASRRNASQIP